MIMAKISDDYGEDEDDDDKGDDDDDDGNDTCGVAGGGGAASEIPEEIFSPGRYHDQLWLHPQLAGGVLSWLSGPVLT